MKKRIFKSFGFLMRRRIHIAAVTDARPPVRLILTVRMEVFQCIQMKYLQIEMWNDRTVSFSARRTISMTWSECYLQFHLNVAGEGGWVELDDGVQWDGHVRRLRTRQTHVEGVDNTKNTLEKMQRLRCAGSDVK